MSLVSTIHTLFPFVAGKSASLTGQRLARVLYKPSKTNACKYASVCVSIPFIDKGHVQENLGKLEPYITAMLENAQDSLIKSLYESAEGELDMIIDADISVDALISFMAAEAAGDRITKDRIVAWFDSQVAENLSVVFAEKLQLDDVDSPVIKGHLKVYRDVLSMLAGGKTVLDKKQIIGCRKAIELASEADEISVKLTNRLDSMEKPRPVSELLEL